MSAYLYSLAGDAIDLLDRDSEPLPLADHYSGAIDEVIAMVEGDFELWLMIFNVVQDWYSQDHERFADLRHVVSNDQPMEGELPPCLDSYFWRSYARQSLRNGGL